MNPLRVGFVTSKSAFVDDGVWTEAGLSRILNLLKKRYPQIILAASSGKNRARASGYKLDLTKENFVALPFMPSIAKGFYKFSSCLKFIREVERKSDIVIVQLPFPSLLALACAKKPRLYHIVTNTRKVVRNSCHGIKYIPKIIAAEIFDRFQKILTGSRNARIITNGKELLVHYGGQGKAVISSTMLEKEIMSVKRKRKDKKFKILFVGYLRPEKGVDILMKAYEKITKLTRDVELEIIAPEDFVDRGVKKDLLERMKIFDKDKIKLLSYVPFGKELFQHYADADVLVLPSRSEGTPRVLIEARAFGCPVIATNVGGVPDSVENEKDGLLIPGDDAGALANAIIRIREDKQLRSKLIKNGIERARNSTVEAFVRAIVKEVEVMR